MRCSYYLRFFYVVSAAYSSSANSPPHLVPSFFHPVFPFPVLSFMFFVAFPARNDLCVCACGICLSVRHLILSAAFFPRFVCVFWLDNGFPNWNISVKKLFEHCWLFLLSSFSCSCCFVFHLFRKRKKRSTNLLLPL